jgi:hypothetical protein
MLTLACEMHNHRGCYKGRHTGCDSPSLHWCECECHPFKVQVGSWDRLVGWARRLQLPPALRRAVNRIERL